MRPRCSVLTGGFDFSGCGDCTSCPPFEQTEMSNSEPSAIVLQGVPCMCGLYTVRIEKTVRSRFAQGSPRFTLSGSRMRSRTGLASPVENQACGLAKYPRLRIHRHEPNHFVPRCASFYNACGESGRFGVDRLPEPASLRSRLCKSCVCLVGIWWRRGDLNSRPTDYETVALAS